MRVGLIPGMSMGSSTSAAVFGFFWNRALELDFAHVGLGVFAGEVLAGGNGSRCEGSGSQEAKEKVEISGVGG